MSVLSPSNTLPCSCPSRKQSYKSSSSVVIKNPAANCHSIAKQACKHISIYFHLPYLLCLALYHSGIFYKVKRFMKAKHFELIQNSEASTTVKLKTQKRTLELLQWQEKWAKCVQSCGECFEEN